MAQKDSWRLFNRFQLTKLFKTGWRSNIDQKVDEKLSNRRFSFENSVNTSTNHSLFHQIRNKIFYFKIFKTFQISFLKKSSKNIKFSPSLNWPFQTIVQMKKKIENSFSISIFHFFFQFSCFFSSHMHTNFHIIFIDSISP